MDQSEELSHDEQVVHELSADDSLVLVLSFSCLMMVGVGVGRCIRSWLCIGIWIELGGIKLKGIGSSLIWGVPN